MNLFKLRRALIDFVHSHSRILSNFTYIGALQIFMLLCPLITYPYLVKVLGIELYGVVLTAQMLANYATIVVDLGTNSVCAKHVSINRDDRNKLSEIVSSIICVRSSLFFFCFIIYAAIVFLVPAYRQYFLLFFLSYGMVLFDVLYPQYFFQGIEDMKLITWINIITKIIFIIPIFILVKSQEDYLYIPILYAIGYTIGGVVALYIIFVKLKIRFYLPTFQQAVVYIKDSMPIFATTIVCTIKDKFNYMLLGARIGMDMVVIYDLGLKLISLMNKPQELLNTVMMPRIASTRNKSQVRKVIGISFLLVISMVCIVNVLMPYIVEFFLHQQIDMIPLRLMSIAPIFLSISVCIYYSVFLAFGYNRYALYSILVTTSMYLISLVVMLLTGNLNSIYSFIYLSLIGYITELVYRLYASIRLLDKK